MTAPRRTRAEEMVAFRDFVTGRIDEGVLLAPRELLRHWHWHSAVPSDDAEIERLRDSLDRLNVDMDVVGLGEHEGRLHRMLAGDDS